MNSVKLQNITNISLVPFNIPGNVHFSFSFTSSTLVRRFPCKLVYFWIAFWNLLLNDGLLPSVSNFVIANWFFFSKMMSKERKTQDYKKYVLILELFFSTYFFRVFSGSENDFLVFFMILCDSQLFFCLLICFFAKKNGLDVKKFVKIRKNEIRN